MTSSNHDHVSIVLIEDDQALTRVWKSLLEMLGYRIACFHNGAELFSEKEVLDSCSVVITDYYLPDLNGVELIKEIRKTSPELPTIVLTGSHEGFIKDAVTNLDDCEILYKPLKLSELELQLERILN